MRRSPPGGIAGAVIDIETVIDEDVAAWSGSPRPGDRPPLRRIICASVLRFVQTVEHGEIIDLDLRTFNSDRHAEAEIIGFVDRTLPDPTADRSLLVTWNGRAHDLRLLRHRACAGWMFATSNLRGWCAPRPRGRHLDMMVDANGGLGRGSWWSLRDSCAGLSVSLRPPTGRSMGQAHLAGDHAAVALRNRRDVVGTLLSFAYWESFRRGCTRPVASAWTAVAGLEGIDPPRDDGTASLSRHHLVETAAASYRETETSRRCACGHAAPVTMTDPTSRASPG